MYRMKIAGTLVALLFAVPAVAQDNPGNDRVAQDDAAVTAPMQQPIQNHQAKQVTMTPEIQAYLEQLARYESPEQRVQRNAAFRSAQRRMRIAAREWYGVSLSRPTASPVPQMGIYSPAWSGTYGNPNIWLGYGRYQAYRINDGAFR